MNKKIILILILCIYFIILIFFPLKKDNVIFIGDYTKVKINNEKITISNNNQSLKFTPVKVYFNNKFIDGYIESAGLINSYNQYTVYNKNGSLLSKNNALLAYIGELNIKVANPIISETYNNKDLELLNSIKTNNNISGDIIYFKKIIFDVNNDNIIDNIYSVQLLDNNIITSIIYMVINDNIKVLSKVQGNYTAPDHQEEVLNYIIDFNNDNIYEIVISNIMGDDLPEKEIIYELDNGEYKEIKEE